MILTLVLRRTSPPNSFAQKHVAIGYICSIYLTGHHFPLILAKKAKLPPSQGYGKLSKLRSQGIGVGVIQPLALCAFIRIKIHFWNFFFCS